MAWLVTAGVLQAAIELGRPAALFGTAYGRLLCAKAALLAAVLAIAAWQRRLIRRRAGGRPPPRGGGGAGGRTGGAGGGGGGPRPPPPGGAPPPRPPPLGRPGGRRRTRGDRGGPGADRGPGTDAAGAYGRRDPGRRHPGRCRPVVDHQHLRGAVRHLPGRPEHGEQPARVRLHAGGQGAAGGGVECHRRPAGGGCRADRDRRGQPGTTPRQRRDPVPAGRRVDAADQRPDQRHRPGHRDHHGDHPLTVVALRVSGRPG
ncbi:CopD family protein [Micromonospora sp. NPDC049900]|uniref:CopD family protein n=1 Tax=Micromonospora sp. NPDC049900 TaxID=3364275 RepID=UPI0037BA8C8F